MAPSHLDGAEEDLRRKGPLVADIYRALLGLEHRYCVEASIQMTLDIACTVSCLFKHLSVLLVNSLRAAHALQMTLRRVCEQIKGLELTASKHGERRLD